MNMLNSINPVFLSSHNSFQVQLYRYSFSNTQAYDNTNIKVASNMYNPRSYSNYVHGVSNLRSSDYTAIDAQDQSSNYDRDICSRQFNGEMGRYSYDTTSPNLDYHLLFSYRKSKTRRNESSTRNSYPRPFRASSSVGALLNHSDKTVLDHEGSKPLSSSLEYSRKLTHSLGGGQHYPQGISGYKSLPSISNNVVERRSRAQTLVVGKQIHIAMSDPS